MLVDLTTRSRLRYERNAYAVCAILSGVGCLAESTSLDAYAATWQFLVVVIVLFINMLWWASAAKTAANDLHSLEYRMRRTRN